MAESWRDKRNRLCEMIKKVSERYGGDDREWLREYAADLINCHTENLDVPIACFEDILE